MSYAILILGESGTGKSTSIRTLNPDETFLINVNNRKLPFRHASSYVRAEKGAGNYIVTDRVCANGKDKNEGPSMLDILLYISQKRPEIKNIVIDDFGYTFINSYMRRSNEKGYGKFSEIGCDGWKIFQLIKDLRDDLAVFVMMHTEIDAHGKYKPKTVGKLMDSNNVIEGGFDYVFHSMIVDGSYMFLTNNDGTHMAHTPMDMFDEKYIPNDLLAVRTAIENYFNIGEK